METTGVPQQILVSHFKWHWFSIQLLPVSVNESQPEMAFYSSAHLNQDWSSGDCNTFKKLKEHLRRYDTETEEEYIQPEDSF